MQIPQEKKTLYGKGSLQHPNSYMYIPKVSIV